MIFLRKPSHSMIRQFLERQAKLDFSYSAVGATADTPPTGFVVDRTRIKLGEGETIFVAAKAALQRWEHFQLGWVEVPMPNTPIKQGAVVAILARAGGLWWANACRIVYVVDETEHCCKFGFAYGTLSDHAESGEERFLVEWDRKSGEVSYDILAFSKPRHVLSRLGYPWVRKVQKRFRQDSAAAMLKAVSQDVLIFESDSFSLSQNSMSVDFDRTFHWGMTLLHS
jgi:uncharacterized protein (UPF0548 family)